GGIDIQTKGLTCGANPHNNVDMLHIGPESRLFTHRINSVEVERLCGLKQHQLREWRRQAYMEDIGEGIKKGKTTFYFFSVHEMVGFSIAEFLVRIGTKAKSAIPFGRTISGSVVEAILEGSNNPRRFVVVESCEYTVSSFSCASLTDLEERLDDDPATPFLGEIIDANAMADRLPTVVTKFVKEIAREPKESCDVVDLQRARGR
ncbi:MAG: hypothetical protein AAGH38_00600, partial [Pseudomonadota bacterium]